MVVEVDIRILVLCCAAVALIQGTLSLLFASQDPNTRALRPIGYASIAMASALVGMALQETIPDFFGIVIAHGLAGVTILLIDRGVRVFQHEPTRDALGWGIVGCTLVGNGIITGLDLGSWSRILLLSTAALVLLVRLALRLRRGAHVGGTPAHRVTETIFWCFAGMMVVRIIAATAEPSLAGPESPSLIQLISLPVTTLLLSAATLGFWSMEVQRLHRELLKLATTDELTGVLNRRAFLEQCDRHIARHLRSKSPVSLLLFDLDHFKHVNDTYGHPAGDQVLRQAVRVVKEMVRPGDVVGRFGGEEFALLLTSAGTQQALAIAERARSALSKSPFTVWEHDIALTSSIGVASFPCHGESLEALIHAADAALYAAKAAGRNCVQVAEAPI